MRALTVRGWSTAASIVVFIGVVIAALVSMPPHQRQGRAVSDAAGGPYSAALDRCRDLGPSAETDAGCHETWRQAREHFFGQDGQAVRR